MKRFLIATDGSEDAWAAVEEGVARAAELGAAVTFVVVRPRISGLLGDHLYQQRLTRQLERARTAIDRAGAEAERMGVDYEAEILEGDAVDAIVAATRSWRADLVIVGSRGHGAVTGAMIGSVSHALPARSPAPVLVVGASVHTGAAA
jgi:nucleotide-binding universal stress UspA family protein